MSVKDSIEAAIAHVEMQPGATFTQEQVLGTLRRLQGSAEALCQTCGRGEYEVTDEGIQCSDCEAVPCGDLAQLLARVRWFAWESCFDAIADAAWPEGGAERPDVLGMLVDIRPEVDDPARQAGRTASDEATEVAIEAMRPIFKVADELQTLVDDALFRAMNATTRLIAERVGRDTS